MLTFGPMYVLYRYLDLLGYPTPKFSICPSLEHLVSGAIPFMDLGVGPES